VAGTTGNETSFARFVVLVDVYPHHMEEVYNRFDDDSEYEEIISISFATGEYDLILELQFEASEGIARMDGFYNHLYEDKHLSGWLRRTTTYRLVNAEKIKKSERKSILLYTFLELRGRRSFSLAGKLKSRITEENKKIVNVLYSGPIEGNFDLLVITSTPAAQYDKLRDILMKTIGQAEDVHRGVSFLAFPGER